MARRCDRVCSRVCHPRVAAKSRGLPPPSGPCSSPSHGVRHAPRRAAPAAHEFSPPPEPAPSALAAPHYLDPSAACEERRSLSKHGPAQQHSVYAGELPSLRHHALAQRYAARARARYSPLLSVVQSVSPLLAGHRDPSCAHRIRHATW